jgi:hypothetical protein
VKKYSGKAAKGTLYFSSFSGTAYLAGKEYQTIDHTINEIDPPTADDIAFAIANVISTKNPLPDLPSRLVAVVNTISSNEALDHLAAST